MPKNAELKRDFGVTLWNGLVRGPRALRRELADRWTTALFRMASVSAGHGTRVSATAVVQRPDRMRLGRRCIIGPGCTLVSESPDGWLELGDDVVLVANVHLDFTGGVVLEKGVYVSAGARIYSHDHGHDPRSMPTPTPLRIGTNTWLGTASYVMPRVRRVGRGAVIAACGVVTKPVEDHVVVAGVPARVVAKATASAE